MALFENLRAGARYMNAWPELPALHAAFGEVRVRRMLKTATVCYAPVTALLVVYLYVTLGGFAGIRLILSRPSVLSEHMLLAVSGPCIVWVTLTVLIMSAYQWFYLRSVTPLDARQDAFYRGLCSRLGRAAETRPVMSDLASALADAVRVLKDRDFLEEI